MAQGSTQTKGFFAALFDFDFTSFITLRFLKVIYAILVGLVVLFGVVFLVVGFARGGVAAVAAVLLAPLGTLLYLVLIRISLEVVALFFRIGEHTSVMAAALTGHTAPPADPGGYSSSGPGS